MSLLALPQHGLQLHMTVHSGLHGCWTQTQSLAAQQALPIHCAVSPSTPSLTPFLLGLQHPLAILGTLV